MADALLTVAQHLKDGHPYRVSQGLEDLRVALSSRTVHAPSIFFFLNIWSAAVTTDSCGGATNEGARRVVTARPQHHGLLSARWLLERGNQLLLGGGDGLIRHREVAHVGDDIADMLEVVAHEGGDSRTLLQDLLAGAGSTSRQRRASPAKIAASCSKVSASTNVFWLLTTTARASTPT